MDLEIGRVTRRAVEAVIAAEGGWRRRPVRADR